MTRTKWVFVILTLLVATNLITGAYLYYHCEEQKTVLRNQIDQASADFQKLRNQFRAQQEELDRLRVWENFIQIQEDLNAINEEINQLNFGNAIERLDQLKKRIEGGDLGPQFLEHKEQLIDLINKAQAELRAKNEHARGALIEFNKLAFQILSGISPLHEASEAPSASTSESRSP